MRFCVPGVSVIPAAGEVLLLRVELATALAGSRMATPAIRTTWAIKPDFDIFP
jgi:hypothetical protein